MSHVLPSPRLDVTLSRNGREQRWRIKSGQASQDWHYEYQGDGRFEEGTLPTIPDVLRKRRDYEAEIAEALADGWTETTG
jgi:hypothetical protein